MELINLFFAFLSVIGVKTDGVNVNDTNAVDKFLSTSVTQDEVNSFAKTDDYQKYVAGASSTDPNAQDIVVIVIGVN